MKRNVHQIFRNLIKENASHFHPLCYADIRVEINSRWLYKRAKRDEVIKIAPVKSQMVGGQIYNSLLISFIIDYQCLTDSLVARRQRRSLQCLQSNTSCTLLICKIGFHITLYHPSEKTFLGVSIVAV